MYSTYLRLGVTVNASTHEVIRRARAKIARRHRTGAAKRAERHEFYRRILAHHCEARDLVLRYRL